MVTSGLLADIASHDVEPPLRSSLGWVATDALEPGLVLGLAARVDPTAATVAGRV
jgi:hypothetical protein